MKKNQNNPISNAFCAGLLLLGVIWSCSVGDESNKANELVNQGNAAVEEGKKFLADAEEKKTKMLQTNVAQLGEARTIANEAIRAYDQAEAKAKEAAGKYDEASKLKIGDKFK